MEILFIILAMLFATPAFAQRGGQTMGSQRQAMQESRNRAGRENQQRNAQGQGQRTLHNNHPQRSGRNPANPAINHPNHARETRIHGNHHRNRMTTQQNVTQGVRN